MNDELTAENAIPPFMANAVQEVRHLKRWVQVSVYALIFALLPLYAFVFHMAAAHVFIINAIGLVMATAFIELAFDQMLKLRLRAEQDMWESEQRIRLVVHSALDTVISTDDRGLITGWNPQAEATFGWTSQEAIGKPLWETIVAEGREASREQVGRLSSTGERIEIVALHRGGHEFPAELAISPVHWQGTTTFTAFVRDITERRNTERQLVQQADELARSAAALRETDEQVILALAVAVEGKDETTYGHLKRMARYAVKLGEALGLADEKLQFLRYGAILHDIGKISIAQSIVNKPGPLTDDEWEPMQRHPLVGQQICAPLRFSGEVGPLIRHHHERWDGTGYVDGLSGEQIPFLARVISVVDAFDSMTQDRPYRSALSVEEALSRLEGGSGKQWDPEIIRTFLDLVRNDGLDFPMAGPAASQAAA